MPKVQGKVKLCSCEKYSVYFKSVQGFGAHKLFDRYDAIDNVVNKRIDEKYRHFLAQPIVEGDSITWFSKPYNETPQQLSKLQDNERAKYEQIKNDTLAHYRSIVSQLKQEGKNSEAECLGNAIKFVNDDFVYCFDNKTVLGIWGMQLRENVREPLGIAMKNLFPPKKKDIVPADDNPTVDTPDMPDTPDMLDTPDMPDMPDISDTPVNPFTVHFNAGGNGNLNGASELLKHDGETITAGEIPEIKANEGYEFIGWDRNPNNYIVTGDTEFTAQYRKVPPIVIPPSKLPWWKRFWLWFTGKGCLKWLLWLLLLLLLLLLLCWLLRGCAGDTAAPIPYPIDDKPWINDDPRTGNDGGIYDPGNPYNPVPTPPDYRDVLPPNQGVMPPFDTTRIIRKPDNPAIIGNRLNVLMENEDKSIMDLAKAFKAKYPDDKYKVVYYDDVVKRMQIELPEEERVQMKQEIPDKFAPEYELFVFDEALFEEGYTPNDPAFSDPDKSWYLKAINAPQAWEITKGRGDSASRRLTVAIVDNGFSLRHPELSSKIVMPYNVWLHSKEIFPQRVDHGTHVAGTALAMIDNGQGICGIAPECAFMPVQVANRQGLMTTTSILDGVLYALYQGADVINISLGTAFAGTLPDEVQRSLQDNHFKEEERLWNEVMKISNRHKAIIVMASGNDNMLAGVDPMNRPKNFIIVSAVDKNNQEYHKAGFSNYGDYSTVSAPGVGIYSTVGNNGYAVMDGTSMAAPIVTGAIALMKSLNEDLTTEQIICILQTTGKPADGKIGNLIQIDRALQKVQSGEFSDCDSRHDTVSTGDVQVLLNWNNYNDLDLAVIDPEGNSVWYRNKRSPSGGFLEIDMNVSPRDSRTPIENIFWQPGTAPNGVYEVYLWHYRQHEPNINDTPYKIMVKYGKKTKEFTGVIKHEDGQILVCRFTLGNKKRNNN
ncbi:MAG: S8 family serine peptidase [Prevotellaceae bacterium]|jgi:hypothetical protein|nr:S8 family serine peptidase [Prevotellaceae bacterium]